MYVHLQRRTFCGCCSARIAITPLSSTSCASWAPCICTMPLLPSSYLIYCLLLLLYFSLLIVFRGVLRLTFPLNPIRYKQHIKKCDKHPWRRTICDRCQSLQSIYFAAFTLHKEWTFCFFCLILIFFYYFSSFLVFCLINMLWFFISLWFHSFLRIISGVRMWLESYAPDISSGEWVKVLVCFICYCVFVTRKSTTCCYCLLLIVFYLTRSTTLNSIFIFIFLFFTLFVFVSCSDPAELFFLLLLFSFPFSIP